MHRLKRLKSGIEYKFRFIRMIIKTWRNMLGRIGNAPCFSFCASGVKKVLAESKQQPLCIQTGHQCAASHQNPLIFWKALHHMNETSFKSLKSVWWIKKIELSIHSNLPHFGPPDRGIRRTECCWTFEAHQLMFNSSSWTHTNGVFIPSLLLFQQKKTRPTYLLLFFPAISVHFLPAQRSLISTKTEKNQERSCS